MAPVNKMGNDITGPSNKALAMDIHLGMNNDEMASGDNEGDDMVEEASGSGYEGSGCSDLYMATEVCYY